MIKRILVIASCVALLVCAFALPASAADYRLSDYVSGVTVNGNIKHVTYFLDQRQWETIRNGVTTHSTANSFTVDSSFNGAVLRCSAGGGWLDISDLTYGASLDITFWSPVIYSGLGSSFSVGFRFIVYYRFADGSVESVTFDEGTFDIASGGTRLSYNNIQIPNGAKECLFYWVFDFGYLSSLQSFTFSDVELYIEHDIDMVLDNSVTMDRIESSLREQGKTLDEVLQQQQQTNDQLGDLNDKQDQTNDKLDGIINDKVDPSAPAGGDVVGDLDDVESGIRDDAQSGLDQGLDVQQSALEILAQYWSAFACVGWIFNMFADLPFFSGLLYVSFALGITGAILGLCLSISRSGSHSGYRRARSKGG